MVKSIFYEFCLSIWCIRMRTLAPRICVCGRPVTRQVIHQTPHLHIYSSDQSVTKPIILSILNPVEECQTFGQMMDAKMESKQNLHLYGIHITLMERFRHPRGQSVVPTTSCITSTFFFVALFISFLLQTVICSVQSNE